MSTYNDIEKEIGEWEADGATTPLLVSEVEDLASRIFDILPGWVRDISEERQRQNAKWGVQSHSWPIWSTILSEENGEVAEAALNAHFDFISNNYPERLRHLREECVQTAAVAVQIVEHIDEELEKL